MESVINSYAPNMYNQVPSAISSLKPVKSFMNIGQGLSELILLPYYQYKKDGRLLRGIQRGTFKFLKRATAETAQLGAKISIGTQNLLENIEQLFRDPENYQNVSKYSNQPKSVTEGIEQAYDDLRQNLGDAYRNVSIESGTNAFRSVPHVIIKPMIGMR
jgi:hypothetical protein